MWFKSVKNKTRLKNNPLLALILLGLILAVLLGLGLWAAIEDSETTDEAVYVGHSYRLWYAGDWRLNSEHPPFLKVLSGLPLAFMDINPGHEDILKVYDDFWFDWWPYVFEFGNHLLYANGNDADLILLATRTMVVLQFLTTLVIIFFWVKRIANPWAGLMTVLITGFAPIMLAHSHYYTPDMGGVMLIVLSLYLFYRWWEIANEKSGSQSYYWLWLILFSISIGLAISSRYSCLILIPLTFGFWLTTIRKTNLAKKALEFLLAAGLIWLTLWVSYGAPFKPVEPYPGPGNPPVVGTEKYNQLLKQVAPRFIPSQFIKGLVLIAESGTVGRGAYLLGKETNAGWWFYFPVALIYKMPISLMAIILFSIGGLILLSKKLTPSHQKTLWLIAVFLAIYLASVLKSKMNLGVRYVLPMIPLAAILTGIFWQITRSRWPKILIGVLTLALIIETTLIAPRFIVYFNQLAGGWQQGWKYLLDSNIDWGQDVKRLKNFMDQKGIDQVILDYGWKTIPLDYYDIKYTLRIDQPLPDQGYLAISVSRFKDPVNRWLYQCNQPETKLGGSIYVYDLSKVQKTCPEL